MEFRTGLFVKVLLVCLFAFYVLANPSLAGTESGPADTAATDAGSTTATVESPPPAETAPADVDASKQKDISPESASASMSAGGSSGSLPSLPTVTNSTFTGSAVMNIPIEVPPGRGGIAPNLALTYRNIQKGGWLGVGWDGPDMGAIQRATKFGVTYPGTLPGTDFVAIVNGSASELVPRGDWGANYFGAKIEGQFSKYYYNTSTGGWEVTAKNGTKYYYGTTSASRQDGAPGVFKWSLDKVQDVNNNYMTVSYFKDNGEIYLDRIDYTGNVNSPALSTTNYVKFHRDDASRPDTPEMWAPNFGVKTLYRLKTIEIKAKDDLGVWRLARAYKLTYANNGTTTNRSTLTSVQQYGSDAAIDAWGTITSGTSMTIFSGAYDAGGIGLVTPNYSPGALAATVTGGYRTSNDTPFYMLNGDFNGDGKTGIICGSLVMATAVG